MREVKPPVPLGVMIDVYAIGYELDKAYGFGIARECRVDFVRRLSHNSGAGGVPLIGFDDDGAAYVEMESLDWGTRRRVSLAPPSPLAVLAKGRGFTGRVLRDRIDRAVAELREPPPLWVGE